MKTNNRFTLDMATEENKSMLSIPDSLINTLLNNNVIKEVGRKVNSKGGENVYYDIPSLNNTILMMVKDGKYVICSHYIEHMGQKINLVQILMNFNWYLGRTRSCGRCRYNVMAGQTKQNTHLGISTFYLTRVVKSIEMYGEVRKLDSNFQVHHKGNVYDNRSELSAYIPKEEHKHRKSHMNGKELETVKDFNQLIKDLNDDFTKLSTLTVIQ